jgi:cytochrome P450
VEDGAVVTTDAPSGPERAPDVFDPRVFARGIPHAEFRQLRDEDPVSWQPEPEVLGWPAGPGYWAVTRYADVRHVLRTPELFSSWLGATQIRDPDAGDLDFIRRMILNMDPPEHNRLRKIVTAAFTRRRVQRLQDQISARARDLLAQAITKGAAEPGGGCDLPAEVTDEFPLANLADLLGVPVPDRPLLLRWTNRVIGYQDPEHAEAIRDAGGRPVNPRSPAALADMFDYARDLAADKRTHPKGDLMTELACAWVDGRSLDDAELAMFFFLLVIAGNDTVRSALPGGVLAFAQHPDAYRRLRAEPGLLPSAIEEVLRWHPPVLSFRRTATQDTELAGRSIRRGDKVVVYHVSANYDERAFPDPHTFDITRDPNEHLAFGQGPHLCLGAHFARLQMRCFFAELLAVAARIDLAGEPVRLTSNFINGISHLPVRFATR